MTEINLNSQRQCIYCHNFCKSFCPSYLQGKDQRILQTQKNYLIYLHNNKNLNLDEETGKSIYLCNDCKRCEYFCWYDKKDVLTNNRYSKELAFNLGIAPKEIYKISNNLKKYKSVFKSPVKKNNNVAVNYSNNYDIYIYAGDYVRNLQPRILEEFKIILKKINVSFIVDEFEISDGILALDLGMSDLSKELMCENFNRIKKNKFKKIVVLSPESFYGLKDIYPKMGYEFNQEILHYTEFLNYHIDSLKENKMKYKFKYFDPCKLARFTDLTEVSRTLIEKLFNFKNIEFFNNKKESNCCGGYLNFYDKNISSNISSNLIDECKSDGCKLIVTSCPLCLQNLKIADKNKEIEVYDLLELINLTI